MEPERKVIDIEDYYAERRSANKPAEPKPQVTPSAVRTVDQSVIDAEAANWTEKKFRKIESEKMSAFVLAGDFTFTLRNTRTGNRFTYQVSRALIPDPSNPNAKIPDPKNFFWVAVLSGPDNTANYTPLGRLLNGGHDFVRNKNSRIGEDAPSCKAFVWFLKEIRSGKPLPDFIEVWNSCRCCKCGRKLTVPESIEAGIGPECASKFF
jgi:hypothetical protein